MVVIAWEGLAKLHAVIAVSYALPPARQRSLLAVVVTEPVLTVDPDELELPV